MNFGFFFMFTIRSQFIYRILQIYHPSSDIIYTTKGESQTTKERKKNEKLQNQGYMVHRKGILHETGTSQTGG